MTEKETLNSWTKLCLRKKQIPICLVTVSKDGYPNVFTLHDKETLKKVFKHLIEAGVIDEKTYLDNREN